MQTKQTQNTDIHAQSCAQTHKYTSILIFGTIAVESIISALYYLAPNQTGFITYKASPESTQSNRRKGTTTHTH